MPPIEKKESWVVTKEETKVIGKHAWKQNCGGDEKKKNGSLWMSVIHPGQKPETSTEGAKEAALQITVFQRTFLKILLSIQNKLICLVLFSPVCYWREKLWRFSIQNVNYQDIVKLTFTRTIWASSSLFDFCSGSNIFVFLSTQTLKISYLPVIF